MYGVVGTSASAIASRELKQKMRDGSLKITPGRLSAFKSTCLAYDAHATFTFGETWVVTHSLCHMGVTLQEAYHTSRFTKHVKECRRKLLEKAEAAAKNGKREAPGLADLKRVTTLDHWVKPQKNEPMKKERKEAEKVSSKGKSSHGERRVTP